MTKINDKESLIKKSIAVFGDKFDFTDTEYRGTKNKLTFTCKTCGNVITNTVDAHFASKYGCPKCAKMIRTKKETEMFAATFKEKSVTMHGDKYRYDKVNYINNHIKVTITCPTHGDFEQEPGNHTHGFGCEACGRDKVTAYHKNNAVGWSYTKWEQLGNKSKKFDSFKLYVVACYDGNETFIKVGRTFKQVEKRLLSSRFPYQYKLLNVTTGSARYVCELEEELKRNLTAAGYKYTPAKKFDGMNECFKCTMLDAEVE